MSININAITTEYFNTSLALSLFTEEVDTAQMTALAIRVENAIKRVRAEELLEEAEHLHIAIGSTESEELLEIAVNAVTDAEEKCSDFPANTTSAQDLDSAWQDWKGYIESSFQVCSSS